MTDFSQRTTEENLQFHVNNMKKMIEIAITERSVDGKTTDNKGIEFPNGNKAKESLIRSQRFIFELHEFVKEEMIKLGVSQQEIYPRLGERNNEIKLTGYFKSKDQDVTVVPDEIKIQSKPGKIDWGVLAGSNKNSIYGPEKEERVLATNIRSQMSSVNKNMDTLFERMITEAFNLHMQYHNLVLGELYLIPVYEYDQAYMINNKIEFKKELIKIDKYISFFNAINQYGQHKNDYYRYNQAALVVADFSREQPKIYLTTSELKQDGILSQDFKGLLEPLSPIDYVKRLIKEYYLKYPELSK